MPAPDGATSTYRVTGLADRSIWNLGDRRVGKPQSKQVLARAQISASKVQDLGLRLDPDDKPPRHVNITGWPEEKEAKMQKAQELAAASVLHMREFRGPG